MSGSAGHESQPPVHVILEIAEAAADMQRLFLLDRVWTGAVEASAEHTDRDREALLVLGNKLYDQVAILERHAHTLHQIFDAYPEWVNERVSSALNGEHFTSSQRDDALRILEIKDQDFAGRGAALTGLLAQRAPVEREDLRRKIPALRGNGPASADISLETACAIAGASVMVDLLLCPETLGIGCVAAIVVLAHMGPCEHG